MWLDENGKMEQFSLDGVNNLGDKSVIGGLSVAVPGEVAGFEYLLLVSESFTITSQVGVKADPQDNSNIYVETVSKFCRNCVNYTKSLYSSLFFLIFFSKM